MSLMEFHFILTSLFAIMDENNNNNKDDNNIKIKNMYFIAMFEMYISQSISRQWFLCLTFLTLYVFLFEQKSGTMIYGTHKFSCLTTKKKHNT